ncbi:unnamed protein product, partial [marine sediment metagenome]
IIGISRRAVEELEKFRLCSYTEKSQRYVTLKGDYVIPEELKATGLINEYIDMIKAQNNFYKNLFKKIRDYNLKKSPDLAKNRRTRKLSENLAKEDARYILSMATQTQLGTTINARNLELMMRRFASHNLKEINVLGKKFYRLVKKIAPSIILFYKANDYDQKTYRELQEYAAQHIRISGDQGIRNDDVELVDYSQGGDDKILASILFRVKKIDYSECVRLVKKMSKKEKINFFKKSCQYMELYDVALREFECANLTYSLKVSAACFGQLKRHRVATMTCQGYD